MRCPLPLEIVGYALSEIKKNEVRRLLDTRPFDMLGKLDTLKLMVQ